MRTPDFWSRDDWPARALSVFSPLYAAATARRVARPGWRAPVPVICCGNATVGGSGKTPLALDFAYRLQGRGLRPALLSRGHGGRSAGGRRVDIEKDRATAVGDEPLLLAEVAPTWVGADRAATARAAVAAGADVLVMDDGLQNPGLIQDLAILVVDGTVGFGNGRVLPAGPLRESPEDAARRCQAAVMIGADTTGAALRLLGLPVIGARLVSEVAGAGRFLAFAGIGRPEKFFAALTDAGVDVAGTVAWPDHHRYTAANWRRLQRYAEQLNAQLLTTAKDAARLLPIQRAQVAVARARLVWDDAAAPDRLLDRALG